MNAVATRISDATLAGLSDFLVKEIGLLFPRERWSGLERGMIAAAGQFGFEEVGDCIKWLLSAPLTRQQIEILAGVLTVGETYFFRDPRSFQLLEQEILPELVRTRRGPDQRLRIWSAGCSSGEEAYSVAILLHRLLPDLQNWKVTILASDINPAALGKGMAGVYGKWSFRGAPPWLKSYFKPEAEGLFRLTDHIRRMVSFQYLNLAEDSYPSLYSNTNAMDIILCRNVLMYFAPEIARTVVGKLHRALVPGGWLIVGPAENTRVGYEPLEPVSFDGATLYRKQATPYLEPLPSAAPAIGEPPEKSAEPAVKPSLASAEALYRQGECTEAAALVKTLFPGATMPVDAMILLVRCHANRGELSLALELCDAALGREKLDPELHFLRAEILQEQGRGDEALTSLHHALYLDPKLVLAHFALGNLSLWSDRTEKARKHFNNALALLDGFAPDEILPGSEGITAGRLKEIIRQTAIPGSERQAGRQRRVP